jgi:hypothetical protein
MTHKTLIVIPFDGASATVVFFFASVSLEQVPTTVAQELGRLQLKRMHHFYSLINYY